jgi:spermidine synthase
VNRRALAALFLISAASVGYEIALTRYFAVSSWSEYGYWVISIVMVGFALSGVAVTLQRDRLVRHAAILMELLPVLLLLAGALGYQATTVNPFNPLELQNTTTFVPQLGYIALYYAELLPFFFLAGLFISLCFVINYDRMGVVYGCDLLGAGAGALFVLGLMYAVGPFQLVAMLLFPLAGAAALGRRRVAVAGLLALFACEAVLLLDGQAGFNQFKPIYAPLHVPDSARLAEVRSPRGLYSLLDDFTERVDTDVSNDSGMLGLPGPPRSFGLYRDGSRIAALPKPGEADADYAMAALDALPYVLRPHARVLLIGASGGFRLHEVLKLQASHVDALEPEPVLLDALRRGLGPSPQFRIQADVTLSGASPLAAVRAPVRPFDLVDISADFLDAATSNANAFTVEALVDDMAALAPGGIVSLPVSIREFPAYAIRLLATVRSALLRADIADPASHVIVYRSAWNVRILISRLAWSSQDIAAVRRFCDDRSFDVSYYPGLDAAANRSNIFNTLPSVSFASGEVTVGAGADDAIADEAGQILNGEATPSEETFDLAPITFDRPFFYDVLRISQLRTIIRRLEALPQAEIGPLVNLAVLAQASVFALLVLLMPLGKGVAQRADGNSLLRVALYFSALGLGFLFIEIFLIERVAFYLDDRTAGFALVLTAMLICSGIGAMTAGGWLADPRRGVELCVCVVVVWCAACTTFLHTAMLSTIALPWLARVCLVMVMIGPLALALGLAFPLGLSRIGSGSMLPWAWGLNGALSVVATPLANLIALQLGFNSVLLLAAILYASCWLTFP